MDGGPWEALTLQGFGFLGYFFSKLYFQKRDVIKCCCFAAKNPSFSSSLLPSLPSFLLKGHRNEIRSPY